MPKPSFNIGNVLRLLSIVTTSDCMNAVVYQAEHGVLFGEALKALGRVDDSDLEHALNLQRRLRDGSLNALHCLASEGHSRAMRKMSAALVCAVQ